MGKWATRNKDAKDAERRAKQAAYLRDYRKKNPDKCRAWQENYILKKAERLKAARAGSVHHAGD